MADNSQKTWLPLTLNQFAQKKAAEAIQLLGKALPAEVVSLPVAGVPILTVKFSVSAAPFTLPNVTVPLFGPEWIRYPIGAGTKGVVFPADAYLGGVSGLGNGAAELGVQPGNLSALVFFPVGNSGWDASEAPTSLVLYGPDGVVIRDQQKKTIITLTINGVVFTLQAGDAVTINGNVIVNGNLLISGEILAADGSTYAHSLKTAGDVIAHFGAGPVSLVAHVHAQNPDNHGDIESDTHAPTPG